LNDVILSYQLLKFCLQSYKQDYRIEDDFLLSPIMAPDKLLNLLPPVRIFVGSSDPLRDDSFRLLQRLRYDNFINIYSLLEKDVKLFEFKYFPHGFLSYDLPMMLPEASVANELVIDEIEKILSAE
jgi:hormone-sensitive lipase